MEMVQSLFKSIKRFAIRHLNCVICGVIALIFVIVGSSVSKDINGKLDAANRELSDIKNAISSYDLTLNNQKVEIVTDETKVDFKKARYQDDLNRVAGYLSDCFVFDGYDDYSAKRKVLIGRIGEAHPIFRTILTDYTPEYSDQYYEGAQVDDGKNFKCYIVANSFKPSLFELNLDTGANTYIGTFACKVAVPKQYRGDFELHSMTADNNGYYDVSMIVECTVEQTGEISYFNTYVRPI